MSDYYHWIEAFHIIFVICWFAGVFYLPRIFVHHAMSEDAATQERLSIMERKLYNFVTPFAFLTVILGLMMAYIQWDFLKTQGWFHVKFSLVILLLFYHFYCGKLVKVFAAGQNTRSHKFYRIFNELPVLILFPVVILVVVKPF